MPSWNSVARKVADHIWKNARYVSLSRATEIWLADNSYDLDSDTVLEGFDHLTQFVFKHIQSKIQECDIRGIKPKYQISSISTDVLIPQIDTDEHTLRAGIDKLSWRAFEHLCVHVMSVTGICKCEATSATRDQGIDFVGVLELKRLVPSSIWHDVQIRLLGQTKYYSSIVGQETVRLFHADITAFSRGEGRAFNFAPDWAKNTYMAQLGFIFALTGFSQGAKDYAALHSIMLKDVEQIIQDLLSSDTKTPGLLGQGQHMRFDEKLFLNHFEQHF